MKFPVTFSLLVFCVLTLTSGHRKVKSPRNFIGVLKQNFDSLCAKISTLEGEVREQRNQMTTLEEEVREQRDQMSTLDDKVREQEEELRELKMQIEQRGPKSAFTVTTPVAGESNGTIKFTNVITNSGGHYNTTSGQFQAEYPGIYAFFLHLYKNAGATFATCSFRMNGDYVMHAESMVNSDISYCFFESSNSVILELAKNDVVDLGNCTDVYTLVSGTQTSFSGYLIQEEEAAN